MSTQKQENKGPTPSEVLMGGVEAIVSFKPVKTDQAPTSESVKIKILPIKDYTKLMEAQDDETSLIVLYTGKKPEWVDSLSFESHELLIAEGERLNGDFFGRWVQRRISRLERLTPGAVTKLVEQTSQISPPNAPSKQDAHSNKSENAV